MKLKYYECLFELVKQYPNDMELGAAIRKLYIESLSKLENSNENK